MALLGDDPGQIAIEAPRKLKKTEAAIAIGKRTTGQWAVVDGETTYLGRNLREAYITAVNCLAERNPSLLPALSKLGGKRRRYASASPEGLYPQSPHLADPEKNNWHKLGEWYVDLNLSQDSVSKRIKQFCAISGVKYGEEFQIREGLKVL